MIQIDNNRDWLEQASEKFGDLTAFKSRRTELSFSELFNSVKTKSLMLSAQQIRKDEPIAVLLEDELDFITAVFALWRLNAVPVILPAVSTAQEIKSLLFEAGYAKIVSSKEIKLKFNLPDKDTILIESQSGKEKPILNYKFDADSTAAILFTSGSTDKPKCVKLSFANLYYSAIGVDSISNFEPGDIWLASLPFYHIGGFSIITRSILSGCAIACPSSLKTEDLIRAIDHFDPAYLSFVPTMLKRLIERGIHPDPSLKLTFIGGSAVDRKLFQSALNQNWNPVKVYGSTETASMITALLPNADPDKFNSAGIPLVENIISVEMPDSDGVGEIVVSGKSIMQGYLNVNDSMKLTESKYFTGDLGFIDEDGYLHITGRKEDFIISGGKNIIIKEIIDEINLHPDVSYCAVIGLPDDEWGEISAAAVILKTARIINAEQLITHLKTRISSFKIPKKIIFIDKLPINKMGKIQKSELIDLFGSKDR